jgi:hypothetical protein
MRLALFSPYGAFHREAGLLYLVSNYLLKAGAEVTQLRCDGAFAVCGRDRKHRWNRTLFSCTSCIAEQRALSHWASTKMKILSTFILPDDVLQSAKWISTVQPADVPRVEFRGTKLWDLCGAEFALRYEEADLTNLNVEQEQYLRQLLVTSVHALVGTERFLSQVGPTLSFVISSGDPLTNAYLAQARALQSEVAVFSFDSSEEAIAVESLATGARYNTSLILEGITSMRSDPRTWAPEVTAIVHEMLTFLGYAPDRIPEG